MTITFTPPVQEGARIEVVSSWSQIRLFSHFPGPMRPIIVYVTVDGTITEAQPEPEQIAIQYTGGTVYEIDQAEAAALTTAGYGAYIDYGDTPPQGEWFLDSTFLTLTSTEFDLLGQPIEP